MRLLSIPAELVPAVFVAGAISAASLLGTFTFVVAQATLHGPDRLVQTTKANGTKAGPPTATARASP